MNFCQLFRFLSLIFRVWPHVSGSFRPHPVPGIRDGEEGPAALRVAHLGDAGRADRLRADRPRHGSEVRGLLPGDKGRVLEQVATAWSVTRSLSL